MHSSATHVTSGPDVSLGIVYSQNTQNSRAYLKDYQANAGTGFGQSLLVQPIHDTSLNYIGTAQGHDAKNLSPVWADFKPATEIVADINEQQNIQVRALQQFDQSLSNLLSRPSDKLSMSNDTPVIVR